MNYDEWWEDFVAEHDEWKYADSAALRRAAFQAGAASRDAEVARLKTVPMRYRRMAFNAKLQDEISELRKFVQEQDELLQECRPIIKTAENVRKERDQLREQVKMLRDVVGHVAGMRFSIVTTKMCEAVLAATEPITETPTTGETA